MKKKANRLDAIKMIISSKDVSSQEELFFRHFVCYSGEKTYLCGT